MDERLDPQARIGGEYQRRLTLPDATYGWQGDPNLVLVWHKLGHWEVLRELPDGRHQLVTKGKLGMPLNDETFGWLLHGLASKDTTNRGVSHEGLVDDYLKAHEKADRDRTATAVDKMGEAAEKTYYGVLKDTGWITNAQIHAVGAGKKDAVD